MDTKHLPLYPCLTVGYLEETKRFTNGLPKCFNESECQLIMELSKLHMDDGFVFWPQKLDFENFKTFLNDMPHQLNSRLKNQKPFMKTIEIVIYEIIYEKKAEVFYKM